MLDNEAGVGVRGEDGGELLEGIGGDVTLENGNKGSVAVEAGGERLLPRPNLVEGSYHETGEEGYGDVVVVFEEPREDVGETDDTGDSTNGKEEEYANLELVNGFHDEEVFTHEEKDEGARDAGEDHGTDGNGTGEDDEPPSVRRFGGGPDGDVVGYDDADDAGDDAPDVPVFDFPGDKDGGGYDKPKEEGPYANGMVLEQPRHEFGEGEYGNAYAGEETEKEGTVDFPPELTPLAFEEQFECVEVEGADAVEEALVNACDESNGAPGDAGDYVSSAHGTALE